MWRDKAGAWTGTWHVSEEPAQRQGLCVLLTQGPGLHKAKMTLIQSFAAPPLGRPHRSPPAMCAGPRHWSNSAHKAGAGSRGRVCLWPRRGRGARPLEKTWPLTGEHGLGGNT